MTEPKTPVLWSPEALDDIDHLWDYLADVAGRATADKVVREIARVVSVIDEFPLSGRSRDDIRVGLHSLSAGSQIVFYRLKNDRPEIARVLDGRRDIEEIFSEREKPSPTQR